MIVMFIFAGAGDDEAPTSYIAVDDVTIDNNVCPDFGEFLI